MQMFCQALALTVLFIYNEGMERTKPARCTGTFDPAFLDDANYVAEPKLDGARYMLYLDEDGAVHLYSRQKFPTIDKAANVPHIAKQYPGLEGTVLDGEIMLPNQKKLGDTTGIMNSLPVRAVRLQADNPLVFNVFDILCFKGEDVRHKTLKERRALLVHVVFGLMDNPYVQPVPQTEMNKAEFLQALINDGQEGIVLKNLGCRYGIGWIKVKRRSDFSVVISGFQQGKGKYANNLGALLLSVFKNGVLTEVGKCSGMTDAERTRMWRNKNTYLGRVVDVFAQEITKDGRLRHPVWHRLRDDVEPNTCTWEKLCEDVKNARGK